MAGVAKALSTSFVSIIGKGNKTNSLWTFFFLNVKSIAQNEVL